MRFCQLIRDRGIHRAVVFPCRLLRTIVPLRLRNKKESSALIRSKVYLQISSKRRFQSTPLFILTLLMPQINTYSVDIKWFLALAMRRQQSSLDFLPVSQSHYNPNSSPNNFLVFGTSTNVKWSHSTKEKFQHFFNFQWVDEVRDKFIFLLTFQFIVDCCDFDSIWDVWV